MPSRPSRERRAAARVGQRRARPPPPARPGRPSFDCAQCPDTQARSRSARTAGLAALDRQHGHPIPARLVDRCDAGSARAARAHPRPLPRLSRPLPQPAVHRRRLRRPDARDPRHHGRPLAARATDKWWISRPEALSQPAPSHPIVALVNQPFVPLRVFSSFTMLEGAMEPKTIAERAATLGFPAVALTDRNGLYGAMPFSDACIAKGVQPIIGAMLGVARPAGDRRRAGGDRLAGRCLPRTRRAMPICASWSRRAHLDRPLEQEPHVAFARARGTERRADRADRGRRRGAWRGCSPTASRPRREAYLDRLAGPVPRAALCRARRAATTRSRRRPRTR